MNVFTDPDSLPSFKKSVITIGSFDGVHLGHRKIISKINHIARQTGGESVLITFYPHPRQIVYPNDEPIQILSSLLEKIHLLAKTGLDNLVVVPFTVELSQMHPDEYVENFLIKKFNPAYIVIGYDHKFGINRQGNIDFLKWYSKKYNYQLVEIPKTEIEDIGISSTKIRNALKQGDLITANQFLGHPYLMSGKVIGGNKIGQQIDFPTANIEIEDKNKLILPSGIYSAYGTYDGERYKGMLYIGNRPIIKDDNTRTIEINLFDFNESIYGAIVAIEVVGYLRSDMDLKDLDELRNQLIIDKENSLAFFEKYEADEANDLSKETTTAVVLMNYNGLHWLQKFIPSVIENTPNANLYLADNGSTDKSIQWMTEHFPQVNIIALNSNYGFAQGYNLALQQLDEEIFVLLNTDLEVGPNWLEPLVKALTTNSNVAAVQPKILDYNKRTHFEYGGAAGGFLDALSYAFCRGRMFATVEEDKGQYDTIREIFWASGACLAIKAKLFTQSGGFDKDYFAHFEEIDLCWRLHTAGYKILNIPESVVYHVGGGTLDYQATRKTYLNFRNNLYTIAKNEYLVNLIWVLPIRALTDVLYMLYMLLSGKAEHSLYVLKAYLRFLFAVPHLFYKRILKEEAIDKIKLPEAPDNGGLYRGFVIWQYIALGRNEFRKL